MPLFFDSKNSEPKRVSVNFIIAHGSYHKQKGVYTSSHEPPSGYGQKFILKMHSQKKPAELVNELLFQLHHAVHSMSKKPLGLFWQFRPSTSNYNDTLYYYLLQDLSMRRKTRDRAERQFTQLALSDGGQKKPAGKNPVVKKFGRKSG